MKTTQCAIITAYKGPDELDNLLKILHGEMSCYVHIDKKTGDLFAHLKNKYSDVFFCSEYSINWGGYEHLRAILLLVKEALKDKGWSYAHFLSGEDYPLMKPQVMEKLLNESKAIYINPVLATDNKSRAHKWYTYKWPYVRFSQNYKNQFVRWANLGIVSLQMIFSVGQPCIGDLTEIYHTFLWGTYPRKAIEYVVRFFANNPSFIQDLRWCKIPEEMSIGTILMNSEYRYYVVGDHMRHFYMKEGDWGPRYIESNDIGDLEHSRAFWCRKVKADSDVARWLENRLQK